MIYLPITIKDLEKMTNCVVRHANGMVYIFNTDTGVLFELSSEEAYKEGYKGIGRFFDNGTARYSFELTYPQAVNHNLFRQSMSMMKVGQTLSDLLEIYTKNAQISYEQRKRLTMKDIEDYGPVLHVTNKHAWVVVDNVVKRLPIDEATNYANIHHAQKPSGQRAYWLTGRHQLSLSGRTAHVLRQGETEIPIEEFLKTVNEFDFEQPQPTTVISSDVDEFITYVGRLVADRDPDNKNKNTFDYVHVEISLRSTMVNKMAFVNKYQADIVEYLFDYIENNKRYAKYGVPTTYLTLIKTRLLADSSVMFVFGLKPELFALDD